MPRRTTDRRLADPSAPPAAAAVELLRRRQRQSVGYLLIRCGQLWNARAIALVNAEAGRPLLGEAHTRLLPHLLSAKGIRMTTLARRLGVSKQAVHQLVAEMRNAKAVRLAPDPADRRARLVHLTTAGLAAMAHGTGVLEGVAASLATEFGKSRMATLRTLLDRLLPLLDPPELRVDSR
jgi:DNA-binding MarR family transcriptional regulator